MADKPVAPSGIYELKPNFYAENGKVDEVTDLEFMQGKNNVGETETLLGSLTNAHKDNYMFAYLSKHIQYLTDMVNYLDQK